jgi:hypothetical protein
MRRTEADERGHEVDSVVSFQGSGQCLRLFGLVEEAQAISEPLDGCPGDEHGAFERVRETTPLVARRRGEKAV